MRPCVKGGAALTGSMAHRLLPLPERVLLGLSGGADSMALCRLLMCLRERGHVAFSAVHVNHGLRGEDADGDEAFVRRFCAANDIPLRVVRLTPPANPSENWAREARYAAFREALAESGARAVCLAHHMDDQAETVLMHLLRGAGLTGLCGMRRESNVLGVPVIRPLLDFSREELRLLLKEAGQPWREDASNGTDAYLRNRVRHELLPLVEQLAPGAAMRIAGTAALLQPEEELLQRMAEAALTGAGETYLPLKALADAPEALHARMLRTWLKPLPLDREQTEALCALTRAGVGDTCNLPGGLTGYRGYRCLHVTGGKTPLFPEIQATGEGTFALGGVTLTAGPGGSSPGDGRLVQEIPRSLLQGCVLRTRRPGDSIRPFGMQGTMSLQDYLVNRRVDAPFRDAIPLLCRGSEVLLVCGIGAGDIPRWSQNEDHLRLTWSGTMPWTDA